MTVMCGKQVGPIGLGLMSLSWLHEPIPLDDAVATLKVALDNGMTLWNGGEFYATGDYNSMTILKAYFTKYPEDADKVTLVIKGGIDLATLKPDGSPEGIRRSLDNIIAQLGGTKKVDLFNPARRDPDVPLGETFGVISREYVETGKIGGIALSECSAETIREAVKHAKIGAVEVELSMFTPDILTNGVAAACAEHDIPILAYSPMGRGMLAGKFKGADAESKRGVLSHFPRFSAEALAHNSKLVDQVTAFADSKGSTSAQVAISWVQNLGDKPHLPTIIPIPGATTIAQVRGNSKLIKFSGEEMQELDDLAANFKTLGERYPAGAPINT